MRFRESIFGGREEFAGMHLQIKGGKRDPVSRPGRLPSVNNLQKQATRPRKPQTQTQTQFVIAQTYGQIYLFSVREFLSKFSALEQISSVEPLQGIFGLFTTPR